MRTCEYDGDPFTEPRSHPWLAPAGHPECRYYDLRAAPGHIRADLEDLHPWRRYASIEAIYRLLEQVNRAGFGLESNDCEFTGPVKNDTPAIAKKLRCSGRVMVLFRELERNIPSPTIEALKNRLHQALVTQDPEFSFGVIGTTVVPVRYLALATSAGGSIGTQLMISFWAWGDTEGETMDNLGRLVANLAFALEQVEA